MNNLRYPEMNLNSLILPALPTDVAEAKGTAGAERWGGPGLEKCLGLEKSLRLSWGPKL